MTVPERDRPKPWSWVINLVLTAAFLCATVLLVYLAVEFADGGRPVRPAQFWLQTALTCVFAMWSGRRSFRWWRKLASAHTPKSN
jgi:hypothetical protein